MKARYIKILPRNKGVEGRVWKVIKILGKLDEKNSSYIFTVFIFNLYDVSCYLAIYSYLLFRK